MKSKKITVCIFFVLAMLASVIFAAGCFHEETPKKLSSLSEEELFAFFSERDITFPEGTMRDIKAYVAYIEEYPDGNPNGNEDAISWSEIKNVLDAARDAINEYYGISVE